MESDLTNVAGAQSASDATIFFGYPSRPPLLAETVREGARLIADTRIVQTKSWEELRVAGRLLLSELCEAIVASTCAAFDVTGLNQNVMFELGYSIGRRKRVWLLRDTTRAEASAKWEQVGLLTTVGYAPYTNAEDIRIKFTNDMPHLTADAILDQLLSELLPPTRPNLFYMPSVPLSEIGRVVSRQVYEEEDRHVKVVSADPSEASVYPIGWYAQQIYASSAVLILFGSSARTGSAVHNARAALVAGLAHGMGRPLLMVAEEDYTSPIDYRDLLHVAPTARAARNRLEGWLKDTFEPLYELAKRSDERRTGLLLASELKSLRLGQAVAENESDTLREYFIETAAYREIFERALAVFLGRKGVGKTANMLQASEALKADARNLVCIVKPQAYELTAVLRLLGKGIAGDVQAFMIDGLWAYLLISEIALVAAERIKTRPGSAAAGTPEAKLIEYIENSKYGLQADFAVRLERVVDVLEKMELSSSLEKAREQISEALFSGLLAELRLLLVDVLQDRNLIAVLIDNLDKAWDKVEDVRALAPLLLGLFGAAGRVVRDFGRTRERQKSIAIRIAVFLRSDIFNHVVRAAREPDKLPISRLVWTDTDLLLRVVEERYVAASEGTADPQDFWRRYFVEDVDGVPTREYVAHAVLPRPRDLVYFCNAAIGAAVDAGRNRIEKADLERANQVYSQFALEAILVENGITIPELEAVLYEFAGSPAHITTEEALKLIRTVGIDEGKSESVLEHLRSLTFLGLETAQDRYGYVEDAADVERDKVLARKLAEARGSPARVEVHPAFRAFLDIKN
jgi:hypothetical protein